jgi:hypothetical protein
MDWLLQPTKIQTRVNVNRQTACTLLRRWLFFIRILESAMLEISSKIDFGSYGLFSQFFTIRKTTTQSKGTSSAACPRLESDGHDVANNRAV